MTRKYNHYYDAKNYMMVKRFIDENIPVAELRAVGFFKKGTRKTDYAYISERICSYFDLKNIFDYVLLQPFSDSIYEIMPNKSIKFTKPSLN